VNKSILWIYEAAPMQKVINAKLYLSMKGLLNFTKTSKNINTERKEIEKNIFSRRRFI